jgi:hypothetical protein
MFRAIPEGKATGSSTDASGVPAGTHIADPHSSSWEGTAMIYQSHPAYDDSSRPLRKYSQGIVAALNWRPVSRGNERLSSISAANNVLALAGLGHESSQFGITSIDARGARLQVKQSAAGCAGAGSRSSMQAADPA